MSCIATLLLFSAATAGQANYPPKMKGARVEVYKKAGDAVLRMYIFEPSGHKPADRRPAVVFFFGGGWKKGSPAQFEQHCRYLASRGIVAMTADYRVASRHGTKARHCVEDGKSAVRWIRTNANRLGVDAKKVIAGGGSAGGHVAACTGVVKGFDATTEDLSVSSRPNALALFNPAVALAPFDGELQSFKKREAEFVERMGVHPTKLSPLHQLQKGLPPTIIFHGKADTTVPFRSVELFEREAKKVGSKCRLVGYAGQKHGFFNYGRSDGKNYYATVRALDEFLISLGYLSGEPTIASPTSGKKRRKK